MSAMLSGIDDVPAIADDKCGVCGEQLTKQNFSDWFIFVKNDKQMYKIPCCDPCLNERNKCREKSDE